MKRTHFEAFRPFCPYCRHNGDGEQPLRISFEAKANSTEILEGALQCTHAACLGEYPIIDGLPVLVPNVRTWVVENLDRLMARSDLAPEIESLLGDCSGPNSAFDARRQHLSNYAFDHYGDFDPDPDPSGAEPASIVRSLKRGLQLLGDSPGPVLDLGCGVGRGAFEMAQRTDDLVLGVDLHAPMMQLASTVLRTGQVTAPRRRVGVVYDRRSFPVSLPHAERVDFWIADALALPFVPGTFGTVIAQNVLDCSASPIGLLAAVRDQLVSGGGAVLATPYDWSPGATAYEAWIGGHSQRSPAGGASEPLLRELLGGSHPQAIEGLTAVGEDLNVPWHVRLHDRAVMQYRAHVVALRRA